MRASTTFRAMLRLFFALATFALSLAHAGQAHVAVASNFIAPIQVLARDFEAATGHALIVSSGASGKLYAQVRHGAPFDVLLSADAATPARLAREGLGETPFTYAIGRLVLWSAQPGRLDGTDAALRRGAYRRLAIANPKLAPYGAAAMQVLQRLGLADATRRKFVIGENIAQTYQFVASGNVELGFVARSQVMRDGRLATGSAWHVPASLHDPIRQDALLLRRGSANPAARAWIEYLRSPAARDVIRAHGYDPA